MGTLFGLLAFVLILLIPGAVAVGALIPAHFIAGGSRGKVIGFIGLSLAALLAWALAVVFGLALLSIPSSAPPLSYALHLCGALLFFGGGAIIGAAYHSTGRYPGALRNLTVAGAIVGGIALVSRWMAGPDDAAVVITLIAWGALPPLVLYACAMEQRRMFRRFLRSDCPACGYGEGARSGRCSECGLSRQLCARCRCFSDRGLGEPCPRCQATLGQRCWRCQYDWKGIESDRCPECGVWKAGCVGTGVSE